MTIYRFKVTQPENEELLRVIDIPADYTLEQLHMAILRSIDFKEGELASFYVSDNQWEKGREISLMDMGDDAETASMADCKLNQMVEEKGDRLIYVYDFLSMWTFHVEFQQHVKAQDGMEYPLLAEEQGESPQQGESSGIPGELSEEDEKLIEKLRQQGLNLGGDEEKSGNEDDEEDWNGGYDDFSENDDLSDYPEFN